MTAEERQRQWREARFEEWMSRVNQLISEKLGGLDSNDLPDQCYRDWFEDGVSAKMAANRAVRSVRNE